MYGNGYSRYCRCSRRVGIYVSAFSILINCIVATYQRRKVVGGHRVRAQVRRGGRSYSQTFRTRTAAVRWAQNLEADLDAGRQPGSGKHTLGQMIDRYTATVLTGQRSGKKTAARLLAWLGFLGDRPLEQISPRDLADVRDALSRDLAPGTVRRYLSALSAAFNRAMKDWQWIASNPCRVIIWPREPRGRVRYLSEQELVDLRSACLARSQNLADLVDLALMTGMRRGELMGLTWGAVDWGHNRLLLLFTKNDDRRQIPLTAQCMAILRRRCPAAWTKSMVIFCKPGNPDRALDMRRNWRGALRDARITDFRFHDLRHTAASYLAMTGATSNQIAEILGHKSLNMVKRYAHLSIDNQSVALNRLSDRLTNKYL